MTVTISGQTEFTKKLNPGIFGGCERSTPPTPTPLAGWGWVSSNKSEHCLGKKARRSEYIPFRPEPEVNDLGLIT